ncbi:uncharacterized protein LOC143180048 [Calliopsis andreniformis]|uniref:uncharacterized protein LOC143180048 n=1 Tax=Calliopsis andreniformis TaxID=337506 RepID=UPI003FCE9CFA
MVLLVAFKILFIFHIFATGLSQLIPSNQSCITAGSFEIVDGTCQNYYICIFDGVELVSYNLTCANSTVFFPALGTCTSSTVYACTQTTTTSTTPSTTTSTTPSTTTSTTPSTTTSTTPSTTTSTTPSTTTSTTPSTTSTTPSTTTASSCVATGRYPVTNDPTCQSYYFCLVDGGPIIRYDLKCPNSLVFNPILQQCVLPNTYQCPPVN